MNNYEMWIRSLPQYNYERYLLWYSQYRQSQAGDSDETIATRYNSSVKLVQRNIKVVSIDIEREPKRLQSMIDKGYFSDYVRSIRLAMEEYPERFNVVTA